MTPRPIPFTWDGEVMRPERSYARQCDTLFVVGARHILVEEKPRSMKMHGGYFARLTEAWESLPDKLTIFYPSAEHLRKAALIATGHCHIKDVLTASKDDAAAVVALAQHLDNYVECKTVDCAVRVMTAKSQSVKAMGSKEFKESIDAVERWVADLIGASIDDYRRAAA